MGRERNLRKKVLSDNRENNLINKIIMKTKKVIYWIATGLISIMILSSATMYFVDTEEVKNVFISLGYPAHIVIPLAIAKILAIFTILRNRIKNLIEWAYAGLFFNCVLAAMAHYTAADNEMGGAIVALILLLTSYFLKDKAR